MAKVEQRHTKTAVEALSVALEQNAPEGIRTVAQAIADAEERGPDVTGIDQEQVLQACRRLLALTDNPEPGLAVWHTMCQRAVEQLARLLRHARLQPPDKGPVTGDRLLASVACHIDQDELLGMAARDIAGTVLALLDGCRNDGSTAFRLHRHLLDLVERYGKEKT
jgi:hypothetical protein